MAFEWRALAMMPVCVFMVIDEVQDLTHVQLALVLTCLKAPGQFLLCGDSNQIVHPNFFSWAAVRSLFWHGLAGEAAKRQTLSVLQANFRNARCVTELANTLLKIKQARFGSIDREINFLVQSTSQTEGAVHLHTPLVSSVHEAKGLEYPHVILYTLVSGKRLPLVDALLHRGANPLVADEFGRTAWMGALFECIAPAMMDVQTNGRLVRLERYQGEYWLLGLMMSGLETLRTRCVARVHHLHKYEPVFFAEALQDSLECLPEHLWPVKRHTRSYVNAVLARAEANNQYQPARQVWVRTQRAVPWSPSLCELLAKPEAEVKTHLRS